MGLYINDPKTGNIFADKCDYVFKELKGKVLAMGNITDKSKRVRLYNKITDDKEYAVIVVDNGRFGAIGLAPDYDEFERFIGNDEDQRRKMLFSVPTHPIITKLLEEI